MESTEATDTKPHILICPACDRRMAEAANAMRRHESQMAAAIQLVKTDPSEEELQATRGRVAASFRDAQSAWDAYREHLDQHGLLPASEKP